MTAHLYRRRPTARYGLGGLDGRRRDPAGDLRPHRRSLLEDAGVRAAGGRIVPRRTVGHARARRRVRERSPHRTARGSVGVGRGRRPQPRTPPGGDDASARARLRRGRRLRPRRRRCPADRRRIDRSRRLRGDAPPPLARDVRVRSLDESSPACSTRTGPRW